MKRRNPLRKIRIFLEHLESNFYNPNKRTRAALEKAFPPKKFFSDIYTYCINRHLIEVEKSDKKGNYLFQVSLEGMEFLEEQKQKDRNKEAHKFQRQLVITSLILAMGVSFNAVSQTNIPFKSASLVILLIGILALTLYVIINFIKRG